MVVKEQKPKIISVGELLGMKLRIPDYQRPYKWTDRNMFDLLDDIKNAISDSEKYSDIKFKYRIGTIILCRKDDDKYDIVDGQQRVISLLLLRIYLAKSLDESLDESFARELLGAKFDNKISQYNIHKNYRAIEGWFTNDNDYKAKVKKAFDGDDDKYILEVVVITVDKEDEAFQLFDSQNTRGRALDPHDLLKAYHLREMRNYPYEMRHAATKWEAFASKNIRDLFQLYLFPIRQWAKREAGVTFSAKHIDTYKGITENSSYTYAQRAGKAMPIFQIAEPFIAGNDFFEMVDHYLKLKKDVETEIGKSEELKEISDILNGKDGIDKGSVGFRYAKELFYCAVLCYYDRFRNFEKQAICKLFSWAFMLRVDMQKLGFDSVNKYALGEGEGKIYSNDFAMFWKITNARLHGEIANMPIEILWQSKREKCELSGWYVLYNKLKELNGSPKEDGNEQRYD